MILGFMQKFPWKEPTNFREKILAGVKNPTWPVYRGNIKVFDPHPNIVIVNNPKIHTIREDKHNRWKPGRKIEMVYRGPKYSILDHFNKGIPELEKCVSVQKIEMRIPKGCLLVNVAIDGRFLGLGEIELLSRNDGFDDINDFFEWFNKDFTGKIIHWTNHRY